MSAITPSPGEIRDYILRRLPEPRRARLEELYFRDDTLLERVEEAEDQLVSDYVLGRLSPADRKIFEDSLLGTPYYRDRIETTAQMRLRLSRHKAFLKGRRSPASRLLPGRHRPDGRALAPRRSLRRGARLGPSPEERSATGPRDLPRHPPRRRISPGASSSFPKSAGARPRHSAFSGRPPDRSSSS